MWVLKRTTQLTQIIIIQLLNQTRLSKTCRKKEVLQSCVCSLQPKPLRLHTQTG